MSCRVVSFRVVSYRIVSYRIVSCRVVSYRIVSLLRREGSVSAQETNSKESPNYVKAEPGLLKAKMVKYSR